MGIFNTKWPFYFSGTMLAFAILLSLYVLNDVLGMGEAMTAVNEFCHKSFDAGRPQRVHFDYCTVFAFGIMLGAFTASIFSNNFRIQITPDCGGSFTSRQFKSVFGGFLGGFLVMLGIQLAGENIYGHLVGTIQLSGSSWLFLISMLLSGTLLSLLFERKGISQDGGDSK
ncbi:MAG: YeeE/YedE family protein [Lentisphaeria bacterium]|nr:YeeE/YedE family protein [Lentisphaeria bacterium]